MDEDEHDQLDFVAERLPNHKGLQNGKASCVVFDNSGDRLAIGYEDGRIFIFDLPTRTTKAINAAHNLRVNTIAWSPCNTRIVSSGEEELLYFWDADTLQRLGGINYNTLIENAIYNPRVENQILVNTISKIHLESQVPNHSPKITWTLNLGDSYARAVTYNRDGTSVLVAFYEGKLYIYAVLLNALIVKAQMNIEIAQFMVPRDSNKIFVINETGEMRAYDSNFLMWASDIFIQPVSIPSGYTEFNLDERIVHEACPENAVPGKDLVPIIEVVPVEELVPGMVTLQANHRVLENEAEDMQENGFFSAENDNDICNQSEFY